MSSPVNKAGYWSGMEFPTESTWVSRFNARIAGSPRRFCWSFLTTNTGRMHVLPLYESVADNSPMTSSCQRIVNRTPAKSWTACQCRKKCCVSGSLIFNSLLLRTRAHTPLLPHMYNSLLCSCHHQQTATRRRMVHVYPTMTCARCYSSNKRCFLKILHNQSEIETR